MTVLAMRFHPGGDNSYQKLAISDCSAVRVVLSILPIALTKLGQLRRGDSIGEEVAEPRVSRGRTQTFSDFPSPARLPVDRWWRIEGRRELVIAWRRSRDVDGRRAERGTGFAEPIVRALFEVRTGACSPDRFPTLFGFVLGNVRKGRWYRSSIMP